MTSFTRLASLLLLFSIALCLSLQADPLVTLYSSGYVLPETISAAPSGFGLAAGSLVVADGGNLTVSNANSTVYAVPPGGGTPTAIGGPFAAGAGTFGGGFAPASFGSLSGDYLAFGYTAPAAAVYSLNSASGTFSVVYADPRNNTYSLDTPVLAPSGFGSVGGEILSPEAFFGGSTSTVVALSSSGTVSDFATISNFVLANGVVGGFGTAFALAGFVPGSDGPVLLVSDVNSGEIDWVDAAGNVHLFTTVPLAPGQVGLRQIAFAPAGFGQYGGDLFVSVAGSAQGGGTFGSVDVINSAGQLVGIISEGTVGAPFDPRGLDFVSNNQLLIADSDPGIYSAPPAAVSAVPEPGTALLAPFAVGLIAMVKLVRRRVAVRKAPTSSRSRFCNIL
jgi:hypothetical protein